MVKTKRSMVKYTPQIATAMDNYRIANLWTWREFYAKMWVSAPLLSHYEKTKKMSFRTVKILKLKGLDLSHLLEKEHE